MPSILEKPKSPKKSVGGRTKRNSNRKSIESGDGATTSSGVCGGPSGIEVMKKRSPNRHGPNHTIGGCTPNKSPNKEKFETIPDSFRLYRAQDNRDFSDSEESHMSFTESTCSSCSGFSDSGTRSDFG